jgi:Zn-dependent peptidase ImmA (M78 family)
MPHRLLARFGEWRGLGDAERVARMREAADHFHVSVPALFWRLVSLGLLSAEARRGEIAPASTKVADPLPPLFSKVFAITIANAIEKGRLSVGKTVKILGQSREQLREMFASHGVPVPVTV